MSEMHWRVARDKKSVPSAILQNGNLGRVNPAQIPQDGVVSTQEPNGNIDKFTHSAQIEAIVQLGPSV